MPLKYNRVEAVASWVPYFSDLRARLRLLDFTIGLSPEPCGEEFGAEIRCDPARKFATIYLSDEFLSDTPEEQRRLAVHELLHAHFHIMDGYLHDVLTREQYRAYDLIAETPIEELTLIIAPFMPLPEDSGNGQTDDQATRQDEEIDVRHPGRA